MPELKITATEIPGLLLIDLPAASDDRGFFQEKFQKEKFVALGFPKEFEVVQQNVSYNKKAGVTRGIHAEPWDKYVGVIKGRVFAAYVDLRRKSFGRTFTIEIDQFRAVFVPRGVANSFQALEDETYYSYLVNDHWRPDTVYKAVNLGDPELGIAWPIPLKDAIISDKDQKNLNLKEVEPFV